MPAPRLRQVRGRNIAMIYQEPMTALNPVLTIGAQIGEALAAHERVPRSRRRERIVELLRLVHIPDAALRVNDYPHELSGGMRQRIMIAMAVACNPDFLIADEPTTALDVTIQAEVLELLDGLRKRLRMGVLLITHDFGVVAKWADRVAVMYAGRLVEQAATATLLERPLHPYTRGLLATRAGLEKDGGYTVRRLEEIPGGISSASNQPGCAFAPRCPGASPACMASHPAARAASPGHAAACHLVEDFSVRRHDIAFG
jgi:peptide/nickel transport system ATP-binding protein